MDAVSIPVIIYGAEDVEKDGEVLKAAAVATEGKNVIRYESPEVFETLTKEWTTSPIARRSRVHSPS